MDEVMQEFMAIDPGLRHCGYAVFAEGRLVRAGLARNPVKTEPPNAWRTMASVFERAARGGGLVIECMQADGRTHRAQIASILDVSAVAGGIVSVGGWSQVAGFAPKEWTRGIPKAPRGKRVLSRLDDAELTVLDGSECDLEAASRGKITGATDHIMDAVGLGLHYLGRLHKVNP